VKKEILLKVVEAIKKKPNLRMSNYEAAVEHMKQNNYKCFDECNLMLFEKNGDYLKCPIASKRKKIQEKEVHFPKRFDDMIFNSFDVERNSEAFFASKFFADNYPNNKDRNLILYGDIGTGKTHLAVSIMKKLLYFTQFEDIEFEVFNNSHDFLKNSYRINQLKNCDLLILDDLGVYNLKNWAQETLHDIIDHRYKSKLGTVVTTNIGAHITDQDKFIEEFSKEFDARQASRLVSNADIVRVKGNDNRLVGDN
jgi:DNA replication protein DnaC